MPRIYLLGDSHTAALGPRLKALFPGASFRFESFSGKSTAAAQAKASIPSNQDVVVLSLGGNDFGDRTAERKKLLDEVFRKNPKAWVIWFSPFHARGEVGSRHDMQAESQARQLPSLGVIWTDTRNWARDKHSADGVHFTGTGYTEIAGKMQPYIERLLSAPRQGVEPQTDTVAEVGIGVGVVALAALGWWLWSSSR